MISNIKTNEKKLIKMTIGGYATQPSFKNPGYIPNNDGLAVIYPGMFGIVNNVKVGDKAFGWAGDHIEPGVSIDSENINEHFALHYLVCTGNQAIVRSGEAKGSIGIVTGEHARNLVHFDQKILNKICIGDQIDIITHGRGLKLLDFPNIELKKTDPKLLANQNKIIVTMEGVFRGPNTDLLNDPKYRLPDRCHFSMLGFDRFSDLWVSRILDPSEK